MTTSLAPVVSDRLRQFRQRQILLSVLRAISIAVVCVITGLAIVAIIDWYWLVDDSVRWTLSGLVYVTAAIACGLGIFGRLGSLSKAEDAARQIEAVDSSDDETLLSAVELATDEPDQINDSPAFRAVLQQQAASKATALNLRELLPFRLVVRTVVVAAIAVSLAAAVLVGGGPRVRQLATRAALPGANVARVSRVQIQIIEPAPANVVVPMNDTVAIVVAVDGGDVSEVLLETSTSADDGKGKQSMWQQDTQHFAANVAANSSKTRYRVRAGDALTEWFTIASKPRPRVLAFTKDLGYPQYSKKPNETVRTPDGHVVALSGTQVELTLDIDQPTQTAELHVTDNTSGKLRVVPLTKLSGEPNSDQSVRMKTAFTLNTPGFYQVVLVGAETGFSNQFSPRYQLQPIADQSPRVEFVDQPLDNVLLPPNDLVGLRGVAEDDLPIDDVEQLVSVNGGEWLRLRLDGDVTRPASEADLNARHRFAANWQWDLLNYKLRPGDHVVTKLVATDLKGSLGESQPMHVVIAGTDFDPKRHDVASAKLEFIETLDTYSLAFDERAVELENAVEKRKQDGSLSETQTAIASLITEQQSDTVQTLAAIHDLLPQMPAGVDSEDVALIGNLLVRAAADELSEAQYRLSTLNETTINETDAAAIKSGTATLSQIAKTFLESAKSVRASIYHFRTLATHNFHQSLSGDLDALIAQQSLVAKFETPSRDRLLRQQTLVLNQIRSISAFIRDHRTHVREQTGRRLDDYLRWLAEEELRLTSAIDDEENPSVLSQLASEMQSRTEPRRNIHNLDSALLHDISKSHSDLRSRAGQIHTSIRDLATLTESAVKTSQKLIASQDSDAVLEIGREIDRVKAEVNLWHQSRIGQLRARRELTQSRVDADSQFAADAGLTSRALTALVGQWQTSVDAPTAESVEQSTAAPIKLVADAFRVLEAAHQLTTAERALSLLANEERWNSQTVAARFDHPRLFDFWKNMVEQTARSFREANVRLEAVGKLDALRWDEPAQRAHRKIVDRQWRPDALVSAYQQLASIETQSDAIRSDLQPIIDAARATIAQFAPTLPEMLQAAAEQARETEAASDAAKQAEASGDQPQQTIDNALAKLQQEQDQTNAQLADVVEALTEEANKQDLWDADQREIARDADDSIEMLREPTTRANSAMQEVAESTSPDAREPALAAISEAQSDTADALEKIAEHFETVANGDDLAQTRDELRAAEEELGIARQMDQRYDPASATEANESVSPQDRLAELEAELAVNPEMQTALEDITQQAIAEAQNALNRAATDDEQIQRDNERSDTEFRERKKEAAAALRELANEANRLSNTLVNEAKQAAARGKTQEATDALEAARKSLAEAANTARAVSDDEPLQKMLSAASEVSEALAVADKELKDAQNSTERATSDEIHKDDQAVAKSKQDEQRSQQQFLDRQRRDANNEAKRAEDQRRQRERTVNNAQKSALSADRKVTDAARNARQKPDDKGRQKRLQQEEARLEQANVKLAAASEQLEAAKQVADAKREKSDQLGKKSVGELDAANPAAQLANRYSDEAVAANNDLQQQADQIRQQMSFGDELRPAANQLAASEQRQQQITEDLEDVADRLDRAARHEARLNKAPVATALEERASEIAEVAATESSDAANALGEAAESAQTSDTSQAQKTANQQAVAAQEKTAQSESAIASQAQALANLTETMQEDAANAQRSSEAGPTSSDASSPANDQQASATPSSAKAQPGQATAGNQPSGAPASSASQPGEASPTGSSPNSPPSELAASPQQLAMTLDELDRMLAAGNTSESASPSDQLAAAAAQAQQAAAASDRVTTQRQTISAFSPSSSPADGPTASPADSGPFALNAVARGTGNEWGALRNKAADDVTAQATVGVSEEYRTRVEAYFRALAERARASQ